MDSLCTSSDISFNQFGIIKYMYRYGMSIQTICNTCMHTHTNIQLHGNKPYDSNNDLKLSMLLQLPIVAGS